MEIDNITYKIHVYLEGRNNMYPVGGLTAKLYLITKGGQQI